MKEVGDTCIWLILNTLGKLANLKDHLQKLFVDFFFFVENYFVIQRNLIDRVSKCRYMCIRLS